MPRNRMFYSISLVALLYLTVPGATITAQPASSLGMVPQLAANLHPLEEAPGPPLSTSGPFSSPFLAALSQGRPRPLGDIFSLQEGRICREWRPDIAPQPGGGFVTVWYGGEKRHVSARIFDADGLPLGPQIHVSLDLPYPIPDLKLATASDGSFVVAWTDFVATRLVGRAFDPAGSPLGEEFELGPITLGNRRHLSLTTDPDGRFVAGWSDRIGEVIVRRFEVRSNPSNPEITTIRLSAPEPFTLPHYSLNVPSIAVDREGRILLAAILRDESSPSMEEDRVVVYRFSSEGDFLEEFSGLEMPPGFELPIDPVVAVAPDGGLGVVWIASKGFERTAMYRRFDRDGRPQFVLSHFGSRLSARIDRKPEVEFDAASRMIVLVAFRNDVGILGIVLDRYGEPTLGVAFSVLKVPPGYSNPQVEPAVAFLEDNRFVVTWAFFGPPITTPSPCYDSHGVWARTFTLDCDQSLHPQCVLGGRYFLDAQRVNIDPDLPPYYVDAIPVPLTEDTIAFWFFHPDNLELLVKMVDGRAVNGRDWLFYGSLSNVENRLFVWDFSRNDWRYFRNPAGTLASFGDTETFPLDPPGADFPAAQALSRAEASSPRPATPLLVGAELDSALRLNNDRFEVTVDWTDPFNGGSGQGVAVPITGDTGTFWFFRPENLELMVKVLDGRPVNGHFWVFYGALTNVAYTVTVTDLETGATRTYENPPFQFASVADTAAFDDPGCSAVFDPVCGVDGITYSNACVAGSAGVEIAHEGAC